MVNAPSVSKEFLSFPNSEILHRSQPRDPDHQTFHAGMKTLALRDHSLFMPGGGLEESISKYNK